jgi:hypothetical protein
MKSLLFFVLLAVDESMPELGGSSVDKIQGQDGLI